jgi:hypothetical protein
MANAECGMKGKKTALVQCGFFIPHSEIRIPHLIGAQTNILQPQPALKHARQ